MPSNAANKKMGFRPDFRLILDEFMGEGFEMPSGSESGRLEVMLGSNLRERLEGRTPEMVQHLGEFVNTESQSNEVECLSRSAQFLHRIGGR